MPTEEKQIIRSTTLQLVNEAREAMQLERLAKIRRGARGAGGACPVARSIQAADVFPYEAHFHSADRARVVAGAWELPYHYLPRTNTDMGDLHIVQLPEALSDFVKAFDARSFPDLNLRADEDSA